MAKKSQTAFVCRECGADHPKWAGRCNECGAWNSLAEMRLPGGKSPAREAAGYAGEAPKITAIGEVEVSDTPRESSGLGELDRVLGGGLVPGSVVLLGGDPGIGKSTLLLQTVLGLQDRIECLYVTGEESLQQVALRGRRLGTDLAGRAGELTLLSETRIESILAACAKSLPGLMVVDSIQTLYTEELSAAPGSVSQLREATAQLVRFAKRHDVIVLIVGHVTKEGALAGPRVLEHMVDTVLYFEGDPGARFRVIRAVKNRFGAANEVGVFGMTDHGLKPVSNPSAIFLSRHEKPVPGSVVMVTREGTRPMLVEVQALVADHPGGGSRRLTVGLDQNRLAMLLAVLHRHGQVALFDQDVFLNVVGGVRVAETAADLASLIAMLSSFRDRPLPQGLVIFGEVGLAGEIRPVPGGPERLAEAAKHGFTRAIVPRGNRPPKPVEGLEVIGVGHLDEAIEAVDTF
ncbi:DNA repair protein RadA [Guyparkeria hydrothermalis]|uniref:DNA repair protein RadA n=1 Tax=Guyparkeria hydrothermalis TaxID=923 RepID=UPI0020211FB8|nr:DNA repair protein RadA [Guyparkeria hydrothermalis]